jgi:Kef-type K+ transport system membrane component KefB
MISASFSDDILAILALSLLFAYVNINSASNFSLLKVFLIVIGFYVIILNLGVFISKKLTSFFVSMKDEQALISMALVTMFIVSILAEKLNILAVTGAFLAGMMLAKSEYAQSSIIPKAKVIGYGFLIPIFFAYIGLKVDLGVLSSRFFLLIAILLAELIGKYLGGYFGAKFTGIEDSDSIKIGAGLIPMGEYTLVTAILALTTGIIQIEIYSILVSIVLLTIFVTPRILKFVYA